MGGVFRSTGVVAVALIAVSMFAAAQVPTPVGLWEFNDSGNLGLATIGSDLAPTGAAISASTGVTGGDGAVNVGIGSYYTMTHGIAPNGGGTRVNVWSVLYDFKVPATGVWYCFFQTDTTNTNDGEYFVRSSSGALGVGDLGYSAFTVTAGTWYRLLITFDVSGGVGTYTAYIDGTQIATQSAAASVFVDQRFSMDTQLLVFADENGEDAPMDVSNLSIWGEWLSAANATELGVAGDPILPVVVPESPVIQVTPGTWVEEGDSVQFTASLTGAVSYQWYKDNAVLGGETSSTLIIDPVAAADAGEYFCRIDDGTKVLVDTDIVTLEVFGVGTLPFAGLIGLGVLVGAIGTAGTVAFRRRKRG